jgi:hypothetical protein
MHSGPLVFLRMYMLHAKPWQQLAICAVFIATGAVLLVVLSHPAGIVLIVLGLGTGVRIAKLRARAGR